MNDTRANQSRYIYDDTHREAKTKTKTNGKTKTNMIGYKDTRRLKNIRQNEAFHLISSPKQKSIMQSGGAMIDHIVVRRLISFDYFYSAIFDREIEATLENTQFRFFCLRPKSEYSHITDNEDVHYLLYVRNNTQHKIYFGYSRQSSYKTFKDLCRLDFYKSINIPQDYDGMINATRVSIVSTTQRPEEGYIPQSVMVYNYVNDVLQKPKGGNVFILDSSMKDDGTLNKILEINTTDPILNKKLPSNFDFVMRELVIPQMIQTNDIEGIHKVIMLSKQFQDQVKPYLPLFIENISKNYELKGFERFEQLSKLDDYKSALEEIKTTFSEYKVQINTILRMVCGRQLLFKLLMMLRDKTRAFLDPEKIVDGKYLLSELTIYQTRNAIYIKIYTSIFNERLYTRISVFLNYQLDNSFDINWSTLDEYDVQLDEHLSKIHDDVYKRNMISTKIESRQIQEISILPLYGRRHHERIFFNTKYFTFISKDWT
jgi:hypothetical protein